MADAYLRLSDSDKISAIQQAAAESGRPANLLEKDVWVVWALGALYGTKVGEHLSFKGGTSLSKGYGIIDRFSEDLDLTVDVRTFIPDLAGRSEDGIPATGSQGRKWTEAVREKLPQWIEETIKPLLTEALEKDGLKIRELRHSDGSLYLDYIPLITTDLEGYVKPSVLFEFGGRSTGEPTEVRPVVCDMSPHMSGLLFPEAKPRVMKPERTFWEKATAAHVYCAQRDLKQERFARHWHDLSALARSQYLASAINDHALAKAVATHKSFFFRENDASGAKIDYEAAVCGALKIVPDGEAFDSLKQDYEKMREAGLFFTQAAPFEQLMKECAEIQEKVNRAAQRQ